jgi:hypothetical protein
MGVVTEFGYKASVLQMRLLISGGLTAAGLLLWSLAGWGFAGFDAVLGALVTVFFGLRAIGNLREILLPRPVIRVSDAGIQDRRLSAATIPWTAITEIKRVTNQIGGGTLFLEVREPNRYIGPAKGVLWLFYALRGLSGGTQTGFLPLTPPTALDLGDGSLLDAVDAHAPHEIPVMDTPAKS